MNTLLDKKSPWWKQPMVWLIIALPLTAVIASIITVIIAARTADTLVQGDYRKEGLAFSQSTERDQRAAELGLSAHIQRDGPSLRLDLHGRLDAPDQLTLHMAHPTQAERDLSLTLSHLGGQQYAAQIPETQGVNWQVLLEPVDQSWRLAGRWDSQLGDTLNLNAVTPGLSTRP